MGELGLSVGSWLLTYAIHSTAILGTIWLVSLTGRPRSPQLASALWKTGMLAAVVAPTLQLTLELGPASLNVGDTTGSVTRVAVRTAGPPPVTGPGGASDVYRLRRRTQAQCPDRGRGAPVAGRLEMLCASNASTPAWVLPLVFLWVIGAAAALFRMAMARRRARWVLADRRELSGGDAPGVLSGLLSRTGRRRSVHLAVSPSLTSPVATGREIVLPLRTLWGLDPTEKATVLAHELAHIERRDPQWLSVLRALGAVLFFQPLNALAVRRFTETAEFACDDRAVELTGDRLGLARSLERVGRWVDSARHPVPETAMVRRREATLVRRVERALNASTHRCPGALRMALVASMLVLPTITLPRVVAESPSPKTVHIVEEAVFLGERGGPGRYDGPGQALPGPDRSQPGPISEL